MREIRFKKLAIIATCLLVLSNLMVVHAQTITLDINEQHQVVRGFGGMNHTTWIKDLNEDNRAKAFGNQPGEIGLSILRIHLDPNSSNFAREVSTASYAIQKGAIVFATPWNAPEAVLVKGATQSKVDPTKYAQYVTHLNAFNSYMKDNGVDLYAISVQNEPDYGEWTRWTSAEMVNFMSNYAQNIENKVMAPESFQFRRSFTDPILNNAAAAANLDIVGGHIYGGGLMDYPLAREKGKDVWMTEHLLGSNANEVNDWNLAMVVAKEINDCMKANFNAYVWWYIRRFYGLITEDGNISHKGYVMSHYSKFIRNGAIRVGVKDASVSQVDATAYKTDSTLVMVVINRSSKNVDLSFDVANSTIQQLTQFTSTATRKMINQGNRPIVNGAFSASVEARSITTFTSYAANGSKFGNVAPTAFAGEDLILDDEDGLGTITIQLDASSSTDSDGTIVNYSWSMNGQQISWEPKHELTVNIGEYDFVLTVTDNDGATSIDTLHVALSSSKNAEIWMEAECAVVGANWETVEEKNASEGKYVAAPLGTTTLSSASDNEADLLSFTFHVAESGNYKVWGRIIAANADDDSYYVKMDKGSWSTWNGIPTGTTWHWDDVHNGYSNADPAVIYALDTGYHTLYICYREDGALLDKILIANTGVTPDGLGGESNNCVAEEPDGVETLDHQSAEISLYPNPSSGNVTISWKHEFDQLQVFNNCGQLVQVKQFTSKLQATNMEFNLKPGVYVILLHGKNSSALTKLIIQ